MAINFLDLFAGAGGLSEGFVQAGYEPLAHIEMDAAACFTLRTRAAFHYLNQTPEGQKIYKDYLLKRISRQEFYSKVPSQYLETVIHETIGDETTPSLIAKVNKLRGRRSVDIIIGGPPCQAYSVAGRAKLHDRYDPRKLLYRYYVRFLESFQPRVFLFENVTGLLSSRDTRGIRILPSIHDAFENAGYNIIESVYQAEQYGVPQRRKRLIIIGFRKDCACLCGEPKREEFPMTIRSLLGDLKSIHSAEGIIREDGRKEAEKANEVLVKMGISDEIYPVTYHQSRYNNERDLEIYRRVVEKWNESRKRLNYETDLPRDLQSHRNMTCFQDRYKVVDGFSNASHTVVAHICKDGHYYIHPDIEQNRSLTPREAARLQTFPDNYFFESPTERDTRMYAYRQIGNAVPVILARKLAELVLPCFK